MCVLHQLILEIGRARAKTQHDQQKFTQTVIEGLYKEINIVCFLDRILGN